MAGDRSKKGIKVVYVLGRWSEGSALKGASKLFHFFCWVCKKDIHDGSLYEHWFTCSPDFLKELTKHRRRRVDYVEQRGRGGFDPDGISPALQNEVLYAKSEEDSGSCMDDSRGENVGKEPESVSKVVRRLQDYRQNKKAPQV